MSQEKVEIVRRFVVGDLDDALVYADPDIVWNPVEESARQGPDARFGPAGCGGRSAWGEYEVVHEEFVDLGDRVSCGSLPLSLRVESSSEAQAWI